MNPKKVGLYMMQGWKKPIMFYQFKCDKHGLVIGYPHGNDDLFTCPICLEEMKNRFRENTMRLDDGENR